MGSVTVRLGCEGSPKTHGAVVGLGACGFPPAAARAAPGRLERRRQPVMFAYKVIHR